MVSSWVRREQEKYAFEYIPEAHLLRCGARKLQMSLHLQFAIMQHMNTARLQTMDHMYRLR